MEIGPLQIPEPEAESLRIAGEQTAIALTFNTLSQVKTGAGGIQEWWIDQRLEYLIQERRRLHKQLLELQPRLRRN